MSQSQPDDPVARQHYQDLLDRIGTHFWARDWAALEPSFIIPNRVSSRDADRVFDDYQAWIPVLAAARDNFERLNAKEYHRLCHGAWFTNDARTEITGEHLTYVLRDAEFVIPPYKGYLTAVLKDGTWRAARLHVDKRDADLPTIHAEALTPRRP